MTSPFLPAAACGLLTSILAVPLAAAPDGLVPRPAVVDFGDAFDGEKLQSTVVFTNETGADWVIGSVQTSCGCTVAVVRGPDGAELVAKPAKDVPVVTLAPGEAVEVDVAFTTTGQRGQVEKTLKVFAADPAVPPVEVPVRARVSKGIAVTPTMANFNTIQKSGPEEVLLRLESIDIGDWSITGFESGLKGWELPDYLGFEVLDTEGPSRRVKVTLGDGRAVGALSGRVNVLIDHPRIQTVSFYLQALVKPDVKFSSGNPAFPESITFDKIDPGTTVTRTITIENADPSTPYTLTTVDLETQKPTYFEVERREIEPGVRYEIDLTVDADVGKEGGAFFRGNMVLKADHPDIPSKRIPFHGWVRRT